MAQSPIATAADYADAMMAARRARNWIVLLLLLMLLGQLAIFLSLRHWPDLASAARNPDAHANPLNTVLLVMGLQYLVAGIDFLGIALTLVLAMVLLLIVGIMLVGRLIGVARVTSAYIWCLVLGVLLFPWQSFLSNPMTHPPALTLASAPAVAADAYTGYTTTQPISSILLPPDRDFKIPGVLYTWGEVTHPTLGANFQATDWHTAWLHWARYVVFPVIAIIILMMIQVRSSRGLRMALGEVEVEPEIVEPPPTE